MGSVSERFYNALAGLSLSGGLAQLTPRAQVVLLALLVRVNHKAGGVAWPSLEDLKVRTGLGRDTLIKAIKELEAAGHIVCDRRPGRPTRYVVGESLRQSMESAPHPSTRVDHPHGQPVDPYRPERSENTMNPKKNNDRASSSFEVLEGKAPTRPAALPADLEDRLRQLGVKASMFIVSQPEAVVRQAVDALAAAKGVKNPAAWLTAAIKGGFVAAAISTSPATDALADQTRRLIETRSKFTAMQAETTERDRILAMLAARCSEALPASVRRMPNDPRTLAALERNNLTLEDLTGYLAAREAAATA